MLDGGGSRLIVVAFYGESLYPAVEFHWLMMITEYLQVVNFRKNSKVADDESVILHALVLAFDQRISKPINRKIRFRKCKPISVLKVERPSKCNPTLTKSKHVIR